MEIIFVIFGLIVAGLIIYYSYYTAEQRRKAMRNVAQQLGLNYSGDESWSLWGKSTDKDRIYSDISLFQQGSSPKAYNIVSGNKDRCYVDIFDYTYRTGSGKNRRAHYNSVCTLTIPQRFRSLHIRSEGFFDKIAGAIGFDDIDFESKEFSSKYYVKSDDRKFAYDIIHPQMMEFLLATTPPLIEINGKYMAFYIARKIKPAEYIGLYNFTMEFYKKIPNYVLEEYKTETAETQREF